MKINGKAIAKTIVIVILLIVFPIVGQIWIPKMIIRSLMLQIGFDLIEILNRIALIGVIVSVLVLVSGYIKKDTREHLIISSGWKAFWLLIVVFLLSLGYPETLGLARLGGEMAGPENIIVFDFRLFTSLAFMVVTLMIIHSILQFKENNTRKNLQVAESDRPTSESLV